MMRRAGNRIAGIVPATAGLLYVLFYLYAIDDISLAHHRDWYAQFGAIPLEQALRMRSWFLFEGLGIVQLGPIVWLASPVNLLIAAVLGGLLAANVHGAMALRAAPAQCSHRGSGRIGTMAGGLPALFAGGACCAPSIILLLGIPGLGAFAGLFIWLIPVSALLLIGNRWLQRRLGAPPWLTISSSTN